MATVLEISDGHRLAREALVGWAVLMVSSVALTLIATPLAFVVGDADLAALIGFLLVAPPAAVVLLRSLRSEREPSTAAAGADPLATVRAVRGEELPSERSAARRVEALAALLTELLSKLPPARRAELLAAVPPAQRAELAAELSAGDAPGEG